MKQSSIYFFAFMAIIISSLTLYSNHDALAAAMESVIPNRIVNTSNQNALSIVQNTDVGKGRTNAGALFIDNTGNRNTGLTLYSNAGDQAQQPLARFEIDNPNWNEEVLYIRSDSPTSRGLIRLDSPAPEIEFVETDQVGAAGKFELRVQHNTFQINSRRADDTTFEKKFTMTQDGSVHIRGAKPTTIEGGLNITGGCIAINGECITPSVSTNAVKNEPTATISGSQRLPVLRSGTPVALDCNSYTEQGAMVLAAETNRVYVCNGPERGWDYFSLTN